MRRVVARLGRAGISSDYRTLSQVRTAWVSSLLHAETAFVRYLCTSGGVVDKISTSSSAREEAASRTASLPRPGESFSLDNVCAAYCAQAPLSLNSVARYFSQQQNLNNSPDLKLGPAVIEPNANDVLRVPVIGHDSFPAPSPSVFFFRSGAIVFWGVPLSARRLVLAQSHHFVRDTSLDSDTADRSDCSTDGGKRVDSLDALIKSEGKSAPRHLRSIRMEEFEHEFVYCLADKRNGNRAAFRNDQIFLSNVQDFSEILAFSYGLAQSVKLHVHEVALDALVQRTESLPVELARHGRISLSATDIRKLIGELLAARYSVNLVSDILDTPEYFWQRPELERLYIECTGAVELRQRSRILDARAEVIKDALHILNSELAAASSIRLERAILFLIGIEVLFEVGRLNIFWT